MSAWPFRIARLAYWLACSSSLAMVWMALTYPVGHPLWHPTVPAQVVWWTLALYAPTGFVAGALLWLWIELRVPGKRGLSYAKAAAAVGGFASFIIAFGTPTVLSVGSKRSTGISCVSNLKQVGLGFAQYTQDYDDRFPIAASWKDGIYPYVKNEAVFRCPEEQKQEEPSYGFNRLVNRVKVTKIDAPETTVLAMDSAPGVNPVVGPGDYPFTDRHGDYVYVTFADFHVKAVPMTLNPTEPWREGPRYPELVWLPQIRRTTPAAQPRRLAPGRPAGKKP
jgi:prepilin-type processing-associated H-X9-DG protein